MFGNFKGFHSVEQLHDEEFLCIPNEKGIYIVMKPKGMDIEFTANTTAINTHNGRNLLYDPDMLSTKYEQSDKEVLYIGKAGGDVNRLKQRVRQLIRYGYGEVQNHRGGRAIWQINDNKRLLIGYKECTDPETAERELLEWYLNKYGVLPVANWQIG